MRSAIPYGYYMTSHNIHLILALFLCLLFLLSGLMKASGNEKGLAGTREVNVPDGLGRFTGALEALGALGILIGFKLTLFAWLGFVGLWLVMAGAIFFHFRAKKIKGAIPAFVLLVLLSVAIITINA
ncbi:MAG: DoxX family membrane protein [Actinobacteria bacterium]|uniref:Unannotated protein n=1 Tax=freshwater metagenome TaxID=449393 RepID=A0A6J6WJF5_9ZZZZ|nr:DoxX family membrane protein [Actinomycetota bacterium]MSZ87378.1 DoxX family membrane protein [Actinomycetota bacterium]MTB14314.1 DoxX family membrane protein [Actinomycetota bacterium]MTB25749.1 DoxX family membrane protein [Actinomycetota bacterium]